MRVRVVSIVGNLERRGTQRSAYRYSSIYDIYYNKSSLFALYGGGGFENLVRESNVDLFVGGSKNIKKKNTIEKVAKWNPTLIHVHREGSGGDGILKAAKQICSYVGKKLPIVETNHFARVDQSQSRTLIDLHFLNTKWCLWKWKRWGQSLDPSPVGTVLPLPVDNKSFHPARNVEVKEFRNDIGVNEGDFLYARVGSNSNPQWSKCTVRSFKKVNDEYKNTHLLLVNPPSKIKKKVQRLPEKNKSCVTIMDKIMSDKKLKRVYSSSQTFVHASDIGESFGMVLGESMLCGTPVVTLSTPLKGNSQIEVVGHKKGGLVAATESGFEEAMKKMYEDKSMLKNLTEKAKKRADKKYSEKRVKNILIRKVNKLLQKSDEKNMKNIVKNDEKLEVLNNWVKNKVKNTIGRSGLVKRFAMQALHTPLSYNIIEYLKKLKR